jgi:hypothetical protein
MTARRASGCSRPSSPGCSGSFAHALTKVRNVRFGSKPERLALSKSSPFSPSSGHLGDVSARPRRANSRHSSANAGVCPGSGYEWNLMDNDLKQARTEPDAYYPFKVARSYSDFVVQNLDRLIPEQRQIISNAIVQMIQQIDKSSSHVLRYPMVEEARRDLREAERLLGLAR